VSVEREPALMVTMSLGSIPADSHVAPSPGVVPGSVDPQPSAVPPRTLPDPVQGVREQQIIS